MNSIDTSNGKYTPKPTTIAVCVPGEHFSGAWLANWTTLLSGMIQQGFNLQFYFAYSSNVYITRASIADSILKGQPGQPRPDYVLWMDDDNLVTTENVRALLLDLERTPEADLVAGWCWIQPDGYSIAPLVSCGHRAHNDEWCKPLKPAQVLAPDSGLIEIDYTGFPVVMMRYRCLVKAGDRPFLPLMKPESTWGMSGEDVAFCYNAQDRGAARLFVDPAVQVPHLKLRAVYPGMASSANVVERHLESVGVGQ